MKRNCLLFDFFELDMLPDGDGGWEENNRHHLGQLKYYANSVSEIDRKKLLEVVADTNIRDMTGRSYPALRTTDLRRVYVEDLYGDGSWLEIGAKREHLPIYALKLIEEESA